MVGAPLDQSDYRAGQLSLALLASATKLAIIEALPGPDDPGLPEKTLLPAIVLGRGTDLLHELTVLRRLGLIDRAGSTLRCTAAAEDLIQFRGLLMEWGWGRGPREAPVGEAPVGPTLAMLVHRIWVTDLLIRLAVRPAAPGELTDAMPGYSLSTIRRYLSWGRNAGLLAKGIAGQGRRRYSLTRRGLLLIRPLCCGLRLEERHLSDFVRPPSTDLLRAGMAVIAQLVRLKPGEDRDILFEVIDESGEPIVVKRATYRDGKLLDLTRAAHDDGMLCIRGTLSAWYDLVIDKRLGGMQAINRGAKTVLRQIPRELRR